MDRPPTLPPTGLPIEEVVDDVRDALRRRRAAVLVAEPGAGKTTVVPLRLLAEPWLGAGRIVVLQPRRVAARASARRMAALLGEEVGGTVGYRTGEDRRVGPATRIEVVTEGILTRRLQSDPELAGVTLVVFDELHERHLQSELGLALCLDVRGAIREDIHLLAMSATLDSGAVADLLGDQAGPAPVITSRGRLHPVTLRWRPPTPGTPVIDAVPRSITTALDETGAGDVLVFLPGAAEIDRVARALRSTDRHPVDVLALHGSLPAAEQDRALGPGRPGRRKVVLATDLAESSLTVEGVAVVVDAGLARSPHFDPGTGLTRLRTGTASRAAADQRAGRAGRTGPGVAYRMWAEGEHRARRAWPDPEIRNVELTGLVLELAVWGAAPGELAWLDPPPAAALAQGRAVLEAIGAVEAGGGPARVRATPFGRTVAGIGTHPRLAAVIAAAPAADQWLACLLAALAEGRDATPGRRRLDADVAERVGAALTAGARGPGPVAGLWRRARRLRSQAGARQAGVDPSRSGPLLARGYPDRLAQSVGEGRLRLRGGTGLHLAEGDPLAREPWLVVLDTGGGGERGVDRPVRLAAALDREDVEAVGGEAVTTTTELVWDDERDDLRVRRVRHLDALILSSSETRPDPGPETVAALVEVVRRGGVGVLVWSTAARSLQARVAFARAHGADDLPDSSDEGLGNDLDDWLPALLGRASGTSDLSRVDLGTVLRRRLGSGAGRLAHLAPDTLTLASGRRVPVDYLDGAPRVRARAQDLYGTTAHPTVGGGRVPVVVEVLSPAGRPLQVTADLPGFWAGSWAQVRREMAGRYPKHSWPADPTVTSGRR